MFAYRGADEQKQRKHQFAIRSAQIDGLLKKIEVNRRLRHMQDDRMTHQWNGYAIADAGEAERFSGGENTEQTVPIGVLCQVNAIKHRFQDGFFVVTADVVEDSSDFQ